MGLKDTASLALIPAAYKTSKIYSALPTDGDGDFTFTRIGNATRINKAGLVETMGTNIGRLNYDLTNGTPASCPSLLLEPSRQNYTAYSEQFNNSYWTKATSDSTPNPTVTANAAIAPDGTQTADKVDLTAPSNNNWAVVKRDGINTGATVGSKLQQSLYLKAYDSSQVGKKVDIYMYDFSNTVYKTVYNYTLTADWERVVVEHTISGANTSTNIQFAFGKARSSVGGSSQAETATDFLVWGSQLEKASYPTSYIPTTTAAVTRTVDKCLNAGSSNLFNDTEGTLFVDLENFDVAGGTELTLSNGFSSNRITFLFYGTDSIHYRKIRFFVASGTTQVDSIYTISYTFNQRNKIAFRYKQNDFKAYINGTQVFSDPSGNTPVGLSRLDFANFNGTTGFMEGKINQAMVFNEALSDSELQTLTS